MRKTCKRLSALLLVLLLTVLPFAAQAEEVNYVVKDSKEIAIPVAYVDRDIISTFGDNDGFNAPLGMCVEEKDNIYVVDTGHNRVVQLTMSGELVRFITVDEAHTPLNAPQGICVTPNGHIYIADTGNRRIVHLNAKGEYVEEFGKPDSPLFDDTVFDFAPTSVQIDSLNYINILNGKDTHGIVRLTPAGEFVGYLGTNKVTTSFWMSLLRFVLTEEQLAMLGQETPQYYLNFTMDDEGYLFTTTAYAASEQIKRLNTVGTNIYKSGVYAEIVSYTSLGGVNMTPVYGILADVAVDKNGFVSVVDSTKRYVYQYDANGNMICRFGGRGDVRGSFEYPVAISVNSKGELLVLDRDRNNVQIFESTVFADQIHASLIAYDEGRYDDAETYIDGILARNATYSLAFILKGKILYKQGAWKESMELFRKAKDYTLYSEAFAEYRNVIYREYFVPIVLVILVLAAALLLLVFRVSRCAIKYIYEEYGHGND